MVVRRSGLEPEGDHRFVGSDPAASRLVNKMGRPKAALLHLGGDRRLGAEPLLVGLDRCEIPVVKAVNRQVGGRQDLLALPLINGAARAAVAHTEIRIA